LSAEQRRDVAARTLEDLEEKTAAVVALGGGGGVVQAYPVG
jgi:hypothetical protein